MMHEFVLFCAFKVISRVNVFYKIDLFGLDSGKGWKGGLLTGGLLYESEKLWPAGYDFSERLWWLVPYSIVFIRLHIDENMMTWL